MAKVIGPLMSMDASGKLANSIVYTGWRGIKVVRQYVIPSNPKTQPQESWRSVFATTISTIKELPASDFGAWRRRASGLAMSGYNLAIKTILAILQDNLQLLILKNINVENITSTSAEVTGNASGTTKPTVLYGTNSGNYSMSTQATNAPDENGDFTVNLTNLVPNANYYFIVRQEDTGVAKGETGEYTFKTSAN